MTEQKPNFYKLYFPQIKKAARDIILDKQTEIKKESGRSCSASFALNIIVEEWKKCKEIK